MILRGEIHYWQPYHDTLRAELKRLSERHANVLLWEAHSIAGVLPRLFDGKLPDLNRSESRWLSPDSCNQLRFIRCTKVVANDSFALGIECDGDDRRPVSCVT
jgi:N-formylglutamate amidohydrolase